MYQKEVFTAFYDAEGYGFQWHVSKECLPDSYQLPCGERGDYIYKKFAYDQIQIIANSIDEAMLLLDDETFLKAAKFFNVRCFHCGSHLWVSSHCFQLADLVMP